MPEYKVQVVVKETQTVWVDAEDEERLGHKTRSSAQTPRKRPETAVIRDSLRKPRRAPDSAC